MRCAAFSSMSLALAACGGSDKAVESGVELPLNAPEAAHILVVDFVEVCSLFMSDRKAAVDMARGRGWSDQYSGTDVAAKFTGISIFEHKHSDAEMHFMPAVYPHLDTRTCMIIHMRADVEKTPLELDKIHNVEGLEGGFAAIPGGDELGIGRWSFVADNGQTVLINATHTIPRFLQLNMSTHRHLKPN